MLRRALVVALAGAVALAALEVRAEEALAPAPAAAAPSDAAPSDAVELRDGGLVRGTIVELRPGEAVVILAASDGSLRTFAWAEVAATTTAGRRVEVATPDAGGLAPPRDAGGRGRPRVFIEARGRRPVHLFTAGEGPVLVAPSTSPMAAPTMTRAGVVLRSVCQAPCGEVIDGRAGYPFQVGGDRMPLSRVFYLAHLEGDQVLEVRPGRAGVLVGGLFATSYGFAGTVAGATLVGVSPERFARPGGIVLGVGLALLASGIVMLVHGRTRFHLRAGRPTSLPRARE